MIVHRRTLRRTITNSTGPNESRQESEAEEEEATGAAFPACGEGEHPVNDDDDNEANVKPARTNSGEKPACWLNDWWEGLGGSRAPSQWREEEQALWAAL